MIGRQVAFYLLPSDEAALLSQICELGPFTAFCKVDVGKPKPITWPPLPSNREKRPYEMSVVINPSSGKKPAWDVVGNHWICNHVDGEVIEFERSELIDRRTLAHGPKPRVPFLIAGRFWYQPITDAGIRKNDDFIEWANSVLRRTKKHLHRHDHNCYLGEHVLAAVRAKTLELR